MRGRVDGDDVTELWPADHKGRTDHRRNFGFCSMRWGATDFYLESRDARMGVEKPIRILLQ